MVDVIFIDDNYLYQNFPLPKRLDRGALLALIQLEQFTSIQDLLGTCLYEDIEAKVVAQSLSTSEQGLFKLVKYTLAMYSAKAAISILRTETARTKNEEGKQDQYILDTISTTIESKLSYINKRITNYILDNPILKQSLLPMVATMTCLMRKIPTKVMCSTLKMVLQTRPAKTEE